MTQLNIHRGTQSTPLNALDVVLRMALTLRFHGTADSIRETAMRIRDKVPYEHRPKLKALAQLRSDGKVLGAAWQMIDQTCELFGLEREEAPRCHMKPMRFGGHAWFCQHCSHVKERVL